MQLHEAIQLFISGYFSTCRRSAKTRAAYDSDLRQFAAAVGDGTDLGGVLPEIIEQWALGLQGKKYATASIRRKLASLAVFFNYWARRRVIDRSPLLQVRVDLGKGRVLTRILSGSEIQKILAAARARVIASLEGAEGSRSNLLAMRNQALVQLMFATGMRVGEVAAAKLEDVLLEEKAVIVRGKGDRQRMAFLVDEPSYAAVRDYLAQRPPGSDGSRSLFMNSLGRHLSTQGMSNVIAGLARAAGIERRVTPHMLRHTVATLLLKNGADIRIVQEFLGHASISTTQRYTHVSKEHLVAKLRLAHPNLHGDRTVDESARAGASVPAAGAPATQ